MQQDKLNTIIDDIRDNQSFQQAPSQSDQDLFSKHHSYQEDLDNQVDSMFDKIIGGNKKENALFRDNHIEDTHVAPPSRFLRPSTPPRFKEEDTDISDYKDLDVTSPYLFPKEYDAIQPQYSSYSQ